MVDDAYNRHAFEDDILPEWFLDHEKKHRTGPIKEMPKDMVEYYRQRMKELNARPIKKIAEAKARKKMKLMRKLDQVCVCACVLAQCRVHSVCHSVVLHT